LTRRFAAVLLSLLLLVQPVLVSAAGYEYKVTYEFENRGTAPLVLTDMDVAVPMFMNSSWQKVRLAEASVSFTVEELDEDGSKGAVMGVPRTLGPGESTSFTVSYAMESTARAVPGFSQSDAEPLSSIPQSLVDAYCFPTETFQSDHPLIASKAQEVAGGATTVLEAVDLLVEYVKGEITYRNFEVPMYPNATLQDGLGDCDDQSILLISMLRNLGIPSYLQVGVYIHPSIDDSETSWDGHLTNTQTGVGWHGWAMVYVPPWGWVPVDLTLTSSNDGLEFLRRAPEYGGNVLTAYEVSRQPYIGESLETRDRIIGSTLYVTIIDEATEIQESSLGMDAWLVAGLGASVAAALVMMFVSGRKAS